MTEYYEEGGLLYEQSPPMHIKVESPEGPLGGGGASEDGFPREDEDSEGSCENSGGGGGGGALPGGLPFNVVVVHPNIMAPGMSSDDLLSLEQNRGMSAALAAAGGSGKRKSRFSGAELEVLVSEVTRCEGELFGPAGRLRRRERERIWAGILERVNAVSRVPRTLREVKKRWDDLKRRNGGRLADARHRTCYLPSGRGSSGMGRPSQASPRLQQQGRSKHSTRAKISFPCFTDSDPGGGDGSERDGLEKDEDNPERDGRDLGDPDCDGGPENSMEEKLGLGLGLGIGPPPPSERWLPPSPLYSAPFFNGSPPPSPQPSLGPQPGPLEAPPRGSWLEEELRVLGEAAVQLGDRVEKSLRDFSEGFRRDLRTLVSSQESLAVSLQQNNLLLQRLLGVLEQQQQAPPAQPAPQPPHHPHPHPRVPQPHQTQQLQQQHVNPPAQQPPTQTQTQQLQPVEPQPPLEQQLQTHTAQQQQLPRRSNNPSAAAAATSAAAVVATSSPPPPEMHAGTFRSDLPLPPAAVVAPPPPPTAVAAGVNGTLQQQRPRRGRTVDHRRRRRR